MLLSTTCHAVHARLGHGRQRFQRCSYSNSFCRGFLALCEIQMWIMRCIRRYIRFTRIYIYRVTLLRIVLQVFSLITHCARMLAFFALQCCQQKSKTLCSSQLANPVPKRCLRVRLCVYVLHVYTVHASAITFPIPVVASSFSQLSQTAQYSTFLCNVQ